MQVKNKSHTYQIGKNLNKLIIQVFEKMWDQGNFHTQLEKGKLVPSLWRAIGEVKMHALQPPPNSNVYLRRCIQGFSVALLVSVQNWNNLNVHQ